MRMRIDLIGHKKRFGAQPDETLFEDILRTRAALKNLDILVDESEWSFVMMKDDHGTAFQRRIDLERSRSVELENEIVLSIGVIPSLILWSIMGMSLSDRLLSYL